MTLELPPRQPADKLVDKECRFYVNAPVSVRVALTNEAHLRGSDYWTLGGAVISQWLAFGCPDLAQLFESCPSPSPSLAQSVSLSCEPQQGREAPQGSLAGAQSSGPIKG